MSKLCDEAKCGERAECKIEGDHAVCENYEEQEITDPKTVTMSIKTTTNFDADLDLLDKESLHYKSKAKELKASMESTMQTTVDILFQRNDYK